MRDITARYGVCKQSGLASPAMSMYGFEQSRRQANAHIDDTATMNSAITYLFVPGDRPDRFSKAFTSGADRIIIDLEDAVRPDEKSRVREMLPDAGIDWSRTTLRINDAGSPYFEEDLKLLAQVPVLSVMLAKTETTDSLDRILNAAGRPVALLPLIETVEGLDKLDVLLSLPEVHQAAFGHLDFALDLGSAPDAEALLFARSRLVMRSRLAGKEPPVDGVTADIRDEAALLEDARRAKRLGFGGKLLIHPNQISPVRQVFLPSAEEQAWAQRVVEAISNSRSGAVSLDGKMIDKPVEAAARRIIAQKEEKGLTC